MAWMLSISEEQFDYLYPYLRDQKKLLYIEPHEMKDWDELLVHLQSKIWRLNSGLYKIKDKFGNLIPFVMNFAQHISYSKIAYHPREIILKSRQRGISTFWLISFFDDSLFIDNLKAGLMSQGLEESKSLFEKIDTAWENFPAEILEFLELRIKTNNTKEISFTNGSIMYVRTSFRSGTLQRLHISEMGKIANKYPDKAKETKTGSLQSIAPGNIVIVESTAEGNKNMFHQMWKDSEAHKDNLSPKDMQPVFLSWLDDPDCLSSVEVPITEEAQSYFNDLEGQLQIKLTDSQKWWWIAQYRELGSDIHQEYPATPKEAFDAVRDGTFYTTLYRTYLEGLNRILDDLYDEALPVHVAMDMGRNDTFVLVFFQEYYSENRIVYEYYNDGMDLEHYTNYMKKMIRKGKIKHMGTVYMPHDANVKDLQAKQTRIKFVRDQGFKAKLLKRTDREVGIENVRRMMKNLWVDSKCKYILEMFTSYGKEWDDINGVWKEKPKHDKWSNPADAVRYMAMRRGKATIKPEAHENKKKRVYSNVVDGMAL